METAVLIKFGLFEKNLKHILAWLKKNRHVIKIEAISPSSAICCGSFDLFVYLHFIDDYTYFKEFRQPLHQKFKIDSYFDFLIEDRFKIEKTAPQGNWMEIIT